MWYVMETIPGDPSEQVPHGALCRSAFEDENAARDSVEGKPELYVLDDASFRAWAHEARQRYLAFRAARRTEQPGVLT